MTERKPGIFTSNSAFAKTLAWTFIFGGAFILVLLVLIEVFLKWILP